MVLAITPLREKGFSVDEIAERIGVSAGAFRNFRRETRFRIKPITRSKPVLVGWYQEPIA